MKEKGLDKKFLFYAHIIQGFDLDPTNKYKTENEYIVEIFMDSNSITNKIGIQENTRTIPSNKQKNFLGDFPFYNEVTAIETDLDLKLNFAPDVVVRLKNKKYLDEEIGSFTVPIGSIKKKNENDYPIYFNFINNNAIVGRLLAMFYICPAPQKKKKDVTKHNEIENEKIFKIYKKLQDKRFATIKVFVHGLRDIDFTASYKKCSLDIKILNNYSNQEFNVKSCTIDNPNKEKQMVNKKIEGEEKKDNLEKHSITIGEKYFEKLNEDMNLNYINVCEVFEFTTEIYGDPKGLDTNDDEEANLTIFPFIELKFIYSSFFSKHERFLIMNLSEFFPGFSEKTRLTYKRILEESLSRRTIDQEQILISNKNNKGNNKNNQDKEKNNRIMDDEEEVNEEEKLLFRDERNSLINFKKKENEQNTNQAAAPTYATKASTQEEINDFIEKYEKFDFHKFLDIISEDCFCFKEDKDKEKEAKRKLRKSIQADLDYLRKKEDVSQLIN